MTNLSIWMLSQFYACPINPCDGGVAPRWEVPICNAYGNNHDFIRIPETAEWGLALVRCLPHQLAAAKLDPRVVVCGKRSAKPPAQLLTTFASMLDPNETYATVGDVLDKLAETEPWFYQE